MSNIYAMDIQIGFEVKNIQIYKCNWWYTCRSLRSTTHILWLYRKLKGKRSGVSQGGTIAFRRAYGELTILRSFFIKVT